MITQYLDLTAPKAFGVAEVDRPQPEWSGLRLPFYPTRGDAVLNDGEPHRLARRIELPVASPASEPQPAYENRQQACSHRFAIGTR